MKNVRIWAKHEFFRNKGHVTARCKRFTLNLDTRYTADVGQVLSIRKRLEREQYETAFLNACFQYINPSETIFEIGTWIGPYSVILSKYIAPHGRLIGFEPDPVAFRQCVLNLNLNSVTNAFVLPLAISDSVGTVELFTNRIFGNSGSSIVNRGFATGQMAEKIQVPAVSLDGIVQSLSVHPTTVKLDIEGAEHLALHGGVRTISKENVKVLVEIHSDYLKAQGKSANFVLRQLADMGKTIYFLEDDQQIYKLDEKMDPARPIDLPTFRVIAA